MHHNTVETGIGELTLVGEGETLMGLYYPGHWTNPDRAGFGPRDRGALRVAERQLHEYLAGARPAFDLTVRMVGSPFRRAVWELIAAIPRGQTRTYGQLAAALAVPSHPRAVGTAVGANPLSIVVPCHRVVGSAGALTGYAGGLERKRRLLELEGALLSSR